MAVITTRAVSLGGIKPGVGYGETDGFSYNITKGPVHVVRDLNATILHRLGIAHQEFAIKHLIFERRLTGVDEADVLKGFSHKSANTAGNLVNRG